MFMFPVENLARKGLTHWVSPEENVRYSAAFSSAMPWPKMLTQFTGPSTLFKIFMKTDVFFHPTLKRVNSIIFAEILF